MSLVDLWGPLPWRVRYVPLEPPEHYIERLCSANGLDVGRLKLQIEYHHSRGQLRDLDVLGPLAERMGHLPDGQIARDHNWAQPVVDDYPVRFACLFCTAGIPIPQIGHVRAFVCFRHNRWLGTDSVSQQSAIEDRDVVKAERLWRRGVAAGRLDARILRRALQAVADAEPSEVHERESEEPAIGPFDSTSWPEVVRLGLILTDPRIAEFARRNTSRLRTRLAEVVDDHGPASSVLIDHLQEEVRRTAALNGHKPPQSVLQPRPGNPHYGEMLRRRPDLLAAWDYAANPGIDPLTLSTGGATPLNWKCERGHIWRARVTQRLRTRGECAQCTGRVLLPHVNDLATRHPELCAEWDADANGDLTPQLIRSNSPRIITWRCADCGSRWSAQVRYRAKGQSSCPRCGGKRRQNLRTGLRPEDLPEPLKSELDRGQNRGKQVAGLKVSQRYHWRCREGHDWEAILRNRLAGTGCPYCAGQSVWPGFNDLASRRPDLVALWASTDLMPEQVTTRSNRRVEWRCPCGHEWQAAVELVSHAIQPCARCRLRSKAS